MDTRLLLEAVTAEFAVTAATTPGWPDPHPGGAAPLEEEYSRCPDPGKYRIVHARAWAWTRALTRAGLATVEEVAEPGAAWRETPSVTPETAIRLHPTRAGALCLLLGFASMSGVPDAVAIIGAAEPAVYLATVPDCGCDACDSGSDDLLEQFDEQVLSVVGGDFVHVTTKRGRVVGMRSGWSAERRGDVRDVETILADARRGRSRYPTVHGPAWY
ncbi:hypothetical protein SacmaDRAFT_2313 [Saccharomonospora marina XMU15]|uniref:Uncharacterized protein n=1 Tax=Saccharomonospora marina XMU15 TaxID=882083 RepID=H5WWK9_9PSEU|nr:DUF6226 family protein [Saccharomonospora marina]EHR50565.1 hypothetical protein SacmaDRAFT_2313 [Saccharomonospora marina XMU15]